MSTITGLTLERMIEIESAAIVSARLENWMLIFTTHDGIDINVGNIRGLKGDKGNTGPTSAITSVNGKTSSTIVLTPEDVGAVALSLLASTTVRGLVQMATPEEIAAGTDTSKVITPAGLFSLDASTTQKGLVKLAGDTDVAAKSSATLVVTAKALNKHPGVPWAMATGIVAPSSVPANSIKQATVTLPSGLFSATPAILASVMGSDRNLTASVNNTFATSFIAQLGNISAAAITGGLSWVAIQSLPPTV